MRPMLDRVTVTGADESIDPLQMRMIQEDFPFVEWGILVSKHKTLDGGCARFPPPGWIAKLDPELNLSVHLCGRWVRDVCKADWSWLDDSFEVAMLLGEAERVQLNFHSYSHKANRVQMAKDLQKYLSGRQVICQVDGVNDDIVSHLYDDGCDIAALYDCSGGAGRLPNAWPRPMQGIYTGYAGGLSPENVTDQLEAISEVAGEEPIWIDAETHLRADDNERFAVEKITEFLMGAAPWVIEDGA